MGSSTIENNLGVPVPVLKTYRAQLVKVRFVRDEKHWLVPVLGLSGMLGQLLGIRGVALWSPNTSTIAEGLEAAKVQELPACFLLVGELKVSLSMKLLLFCLADSFIFFFFLSLTRMPFTQ